MIRTPLLDALRVEIVPFVTREGCYHVISLEVFKTDHTLLHVVKLLLIEDARQLAKIEYTIHARRLTVVVRICTIFSVSGLVLRAAFSCLVGLVDTSFTAQKSATKDYDDNCEDAKHYQLIVLE